MPRVNPAKAWCFTLNNYTQEELGALVQQFQTLADQYFYIVGEEIGEQGTPHLQGYIEKRTGRFRPLPKFAVLRDNSNQEGTLTQAMHFEKAKGNRKQNYKYCSKDGKYVTNIPRPVMTYSEAQDIWKATGGISNEEYTPGDINEASLHIMFVEEYDTMPDELQRHFMKDYKGMMAERYPAVDDATA